MKLVPLVVKICDRCEAGIATKADAKLMSVDIVFIYLGVQRKYLLLMFDNHQTQG